MKHPALQLKEALAAGRIVQAPGAFDALSARLVERAGFPAVYMTGFGATAARQGQPDISLLTQTEMTTHACGTDQLPVIGRTDALPAAGMSEAASRAKRDQDVGVDLVFIDGIKTVAEVEAVACQVTGPKVVSIVDGTDASARDATALQAMGFELVFFAVTALFSAARAVEQALADLRRHGTPRALVPAGMSYTDFSLVVGLSEHQHLDHDFGATS